MPRRIKEMDTQVTEYVKQLRWKWRLLRFRAGCSTVRAAADKTGLTFVFISQAERMDLDYMPTVESLLRLARGYEVDPEEMLSSRLPLDAFKHHGSDWNAFLMADKNRPIIRLAWMLAQPDLTPLADANPSEWELLAWAADPRNLVYLTKARQLVEVAKAVMAS